MKAEMSQASCRGAPGMGHLQAATGMPQVGLKLYGRRMLSFPEGRYQLSWINRLN